MIRNTCILALITIAIAFAQSPSARIRYLYPASVEAGSGDFELQVGGAALFDGLLVRFNNVDHPASFNDGALFATISAREIARPGLAEVLVYDPATRVTIGPRRLMAVSVPLQVKNLITDPRRNRIYAALLGDERSPATAIAAVDPVTGTAERTIEVGQKPNLMALSDDARFLYVSLDGESSIRRVDLDAWTADLTIPLGPNAAATAVAVMPGNPETIAVSRNANPKIAVAIYDRTVKRPNESKASMTSLAFGAQPSILYGEGGSSFFTRMTIDANGIASEKQDTSLGTLGYYGSDIAFAGGLLYHTDGYVIDPETSAYMGDYGFTRSPIVMDPEHNRLLALGSGGLLAAFDLQDYTPLGTLQLAAAAYNPPNWSNPVRWGSDGIACITVDRYYPTGGRLFIFRTPLAGPAPAITAIQGVIAPGQQITLWGSNLGPSGGRDTEYGSPGRVSTTLAGVQVLFDATPAQILYASDVQVNLVVPDTVAGPTTLQLLNNGVPSRQIFLNLGDLDPKVSE